MPQSLLNIMISVFQTNDTVLARSSVSPRNTSGSTDCSFPPMKALKPGRRTQFGVLPDQRERNETICYCDAGDARLMKNQPLTSVVVPAYNAERFIERTLRSALNQTYRNLELIVVDDGSTDNTKTIAEAFAARDSRVRIVSVRNGGVAKARNIGIDQASGAFIAFLDADDLWSPNKIELQVAALNSSNNNEAVAVYTLRRSIDADDRVLGNGNNAGFDGYAFARHLYTMPVGNGSSMLVRREIAAAVGGFDSSFAACGIGGCEDLDFELKIAAEYHMVVIPQYLVGYRMYPGNMSSDRLRMSNALAATIARHIQSHPGLPSFAARSVRAVSYEYGVSTLITGRYWKQAALKFGILLRTDFGRGLGFGTSIVKRMLLRKLVRLKRAILRQVPEPFEGPLFQELSPDVDPSVGVRCSRDRKIIERLEKVDALLAVDAMFAKQTGVRVAPKAVALG